MYGKKDNIEEMTERNTHNSTTAKDNRHGSFIAIFVHKKKNENENDEAKKNRKMPTIITTMMMMST